ncbi:ATP-binding protein, partial [Candidatus Bathyarchaeota archaeon]|nr:ATP-binding protein [Candidatus Bathyarchaeota archaeon]
KTEAPTEADLDYGSLRLIRTPLTQEEVFAISRILAEKQRLQIRSFDLPAKGRLDRLYGPYVASQQKFAQIRPKWPSVFYQLRLEQDSVGSSPHHPLIKLGLPSYPSGNEAIGEFCDLELEHGVPDPQIVFVLPDFRARITTLNLKERKLTVNVEAREESPENLRVKFYVKCDGKSFSSDDLSLRNGTAEYTYQGDALDQAMVHLLSVTNGDVIDDRAFGRWGDSAREGIVIEASELRVKELIRGGEGPHVEFKEEFPSDEHRILDTMVAFANTTGGTILVGVKDDGEISGIHKSIEEIEETLTNWVSEKCDPRPAYSFHHIDTDGKTVVLLDVQTGPNRPYQDVDRGFFVRRGASNRQARRSEVEEMFRSPRII